MKYILAIDQGTSSTKSVVFDEEGKVVATGHEILNTQYFDNGYVEQNAAEIIENVRASVRKCLTVCLNSGLQLTDIVACGISNQRETFVLWDKDGHALSPAIVWACKRSVEICKTLIEGGQNDVVKSKTGLIVDPYFSATKLIHFLESRPDLKKKVEAEEVYFGTIDTWLLYHFTGGKAFKTDHTNAHRTLLFNINELVWDQELLHKWGLSSLNLPEVLPSASSFGQLDFAFIDNRFEGVCEIASMIGDSHAATFGEGCFEKGTAKVTMGTGSSIMVNTGKQIANSNHGLLTTICYSTNSGVNYALEGSIVACGSTIEWLKNELNLFENAADTEKMAESIDDNGGVYLIPAFSGLGAPHWQMDRKASIEGLTFGTTKNHIVRAALESIPFQINDVISAVNSDLGFEIQSIAVNGGISKNKFVLTYLVNLLGITLNKLSNADISAYGAACLAGLKIGLFLNIEKIQEINLKNSQQIHPTAKWHPVQMEYEVWKKKIIEYKRNY
ncbi:MAG: glycerol kinase GlpK [Saprospiraceae bacterium]|nr:glycerol kinase GlpK [Saprospiraceae bacterium]